MEREINVILATDCGSTTTKAILIKRIDGEYRLISRGEAPTTVEAPFEDVTRGVLNSITEVEEISRHRILEKEEIIMPNNGRSGVDAYVSTSSAGGGLQMMVLGAVKTMSAESAERAALGGGAIVMDVIATNDGRPPHERIERIRQLRPDMILLSGGTDGGSITHVVELAEYIAAACPKPRFGEESRLPIIYAGNKDARGEIKEILKKKTALSITENIRPTLERENLLPAKHRIHDLFLEHVMAQAPGYGKLMSWTTSEILPTPVAVGLIMELIAKKRGINLIGVDIGGATTDTFSVFRSIFNRTVSANLGMSYSISNVLSSARIENITRWIPDTLRDEDLRNGIKNKMIRPTTIPQTIQELKIEQAIAREALRLSFHQHKMLAVGLKGVRQERSISEAFSQTPTGQTLIDMKGLDMIVGSGGVLSHAPRRNQAMMILIDAYEPLGITRLAVDSIFMMPHLGVLSTINEQAAIQVFERDCLVHLGTCISAEGKGKEDQPCLEYEINYPYGKTEKGAINYGEIMLFPLSFEEEADVTIRPKRGFDVGEGKGKAIQSKVSGGVVGLVIDARGRPLRLSQDKKKRTSQLVKWSRAMDLYPEG
ncbi:MAG: glutamate mutase L [bacterium]|nr:glutamate mutase L [bacterium]